jgi:hypothetical protein
MKCESFPTRNLGCVDWFRKDQSYIYDIDDSGIPLARGYGADSSWVPLPIYPNSRRFAFLPQTITYIRHDDQLACFALMLGLELRNSEEKLEFLGRKKVQLMPHLHKCANFYCGSQAKLLKLKNMNILGSGEHRRLLQDCHDFRTYVGGRALFDYLHGVLPLSSKMLGACYHMGAQESSKQITYLPGHLDKAFVCSGWLIPLDVSFFTLVAFPTAWHYQQDEPSLRSYNEWIDTLEKKEKENLLKFAAAFRDDAKIPMKNVDFKIYIFENKLGSLLAFPTNICYHTTVTPPSTVPRDLLIIHPLVGDKLL